MSEATTRNNLAAMRVAPVRISGQVLRTWIAETSSQRSLGLSYVQPWEIAINQGMLFVYAQDVDLGFLSTNTPTSLDIAFISSTSTIINIQSMTAYSPTRHASPSPYRFALEVHRGSFARWGVQAGQTVTIPWSVTHPADINSDNHVNILDLLAMTNAWNSRAAPLTANWNPNADLNGDAVVNITDVQLLIASWGDAAD